MVIMRDPRHDDYVIIGIDEMIDYSCWQVVEYVNGGK